MKNKKKINAITNLFYLLNNGNEYLGIEDNTLQIASLWQMQGHKTLFFSNKISSFDPHTLIFTDKVRYAYLMIWEVAVISTCRGKGYHYQYVCFYFLQSCWNPDAHLQWEHPTEAREAVDRHPYISPNPIWRTVWHPLLGIDDTTVGSDILASEEASQGSHFGVLECNFCNNKGIVGIPGFSEVCCKINKADSVELGLTSC